MSEPSMAYGTSFRFSLQSSVCPTFSVASEHSRIDCAANACAVRECSSVRPWQAASRPAWSAWSETAGWVCCSCRWWKWPPVRSASGSSLVASQACVSAPGPISPGRWGRPFSF
jgi:hypothetical protein